MFVQSAGANGKKLLPEIFLSYQKRISSMDVFIILQLSANDFRVRTKGGEQQHQNKPRQIRLLTLLSADAKPAVICVLLMIPSLTKVEVCNFLLLHFPRWFCLIPGQLGMSLRRVKRSVIYKCQCFRLFDIQQWSVLSQVLLSPSLKSPLKKIHLKGNCYVSILNFHSPKY